MQLIPKENAREDVARALVLAEVFGTPYSETPLYALERALRGGSVEYRVHEAEDAGELAAIAIFGSVAGTIGTARLYLAAPTSGAGRAHALVAIEAAVSELAAEGTRLLIAELPDDVCMGEMRKLLLECAFQEESRVEDLFRDGVALTFLRREVTARRES